MTTRVEKNPFIKKSCYDCAFIVGYVSLWCTNKDAIRDRGTSIPGCIHCPYWEPDWDYIKEKYKTIENGYHPKIGILQRIKKYFSKLWSDLKIILLP